MGVVGSVLVVCKDVDFLATEGCYIAKGLTICGLAGSLPIKRVVATPTASLTEDHLF